MSTQTAPTKSNLIAAKKSLALSRLGYDLLDRKRSILIREMMALIAQADEVQSQIGQIYGEAYAALQRANITLGNSEKFVGSIPLDTRLKVDVRSVMGVELPTVVLPNDPDRIPYGLRATNSMLDEAYRKFIRVKHLTVKLAEVENSVYRLAEAIKKTQKRVGALKNVLIPRFESTIKTISESLEEKEREEFSRLKQIKKRE